MKLLISPINEKEADEAVAGGADIIDVKNPQEGALGANFPWIIKKIKQKIPNNFELSCALGDVPNLPGSVSLAAYGAASLGVDYIKVGLFGTRTIEESVFLLKQVKKAAKDCNSSIKIVAAGYADGQKIGTINPASIPEIASSADVDIAMLDTISKEGTNLFTYQTKQQLKDFIGSSHNYGLHAALAGSLRKQDLPILYHLGVDIVGLRGAACTNNDRNRGQMSRTLVCDLVEVVEQLKR